MATTGQANIRFYGLVNGSYTMDDVRILDSNLSGSMTLGGRDCFVATPLPAMTMGQVIVEDQSHSPFICNHLCHIIRGILGVTP